MTPLSALRPAAANLPESGILKVFNFGRTVEGVIPLWAGEGDLPTPAVIHRAVAASLEAGETFYTNNRGLPELREALARYTGKLYGLDLPADEFLVTGGGMQAIMLAFQAILGEGDEALLPTPAWPNFPGALGILGARAIPVPMTLSAQGWHLPLDRLFSSVSPRTRAIVINSPGNPTGWTASSEELRQILAFARERGLWIIADEIYARFHYAGGVAPSFLAHRQPGDRIIFVNTFSKNWAMTGWRIGWMQAPAEIIPVLEKLVQFNTSGTAVFLQRGGLAALTQGEAFFAEQIERAKAGREIVMRHLGRSNRIRMAAPDGAFYAFFAIDGLTDSMAAALSLVSEAKVGLAPGIAFGESAEGYFRLCFLRSPKPLEEALRRLTEWLERSRT